MDYNNNDNSFSMITDIDGDFSDLNNAEMPQTVPLLVTRNLVLFPGIVTSIIIARSKSVKLIKKCEHTHEIIGVAPQYDSYIENPTRQDIFDFGVYARIVKVFELPGGNLSAIIQGLGRLRIDDIVNENPYLIANVNNAPETIEYSKDKEFSAAVDDLRKSTVKYIRLN